MANTDPQIDRWRQEWKVIHDDTVRLVHNRRMFREIMRIVNANPKPPKQNVVYGWMIDAYVALAPVAVRRLGVDRGSHVISVRQILKEIATSPQVITRTWFVSQYHEPAVRWANTDFDKFDPGQQGSVDPKIVRDDLAQLQAVAKVITRFVNTYVAHRNKAVALGEVATPPTVTWGQLDTAIDTLVQLLAKYELLLNQAGMLGAEPVIQSDWQEVFRLPWI